MPIIIIISIMIMISEVTYPAFLIVTLGSVTIIAFFIKIIIIMAIIMTITMTMIIMMIMK